MENVLEGYRSRGVFEKTAQIAKGLGVEIPEGEEQAALDPDRALDWAIRVLTLENKFKHTVGGRLDTATAETLKEVELDPIDVQGAKLSFVQLFSRFAVEAAIAKDPTATAETISNFRGGGIPVDQWAQQKNASIYETFDPNQDIPRQIEEFEKKQEAMQLVYNPLEGVIRSGKLVSFVEEVNKTRNQT